MNFTGITLKLNSLFAGGAVVHHTSLLGADGDVVNTVEVTNLSSAMIDALVNWLINIVLKVIYLVCTFVLNLIEFFQFVISSILGISVDISDYAVLDMKNPLIKILTSEAFLTTFKIVLGVSLVLIIVFTIFAIVKSEYARAVDGDVEVNSTGRIFGRTLRSIFTMGMFPLILLASIILINAILAGFNDILRGGENTTLAGQIFISSAYGANNYRRYANDDVRVPIIINFEDPIELGQGNAYSAEELAAIYKNFQPTGKTLYDNFADYDFESFSSTIVYRNNRLYNEQSYNGFEKFVCTREQYYVMADFLDFAIKNNLKYYIKNMKDSDINWKYVSNTIYDKEQGTLTITYKDASNLYDGVSYTVVYAPSSEDISTPISDAIKTITALLAIGDFSDNTFNILSRLEESINVVEWETDKVYLRLSDSLRTAINEGKSATAIKNAMTVTDKLILYERARLEYNNSLDCTINDLINGVELPLQKLEKRIYQPSTGSFITTETYYVVKINGTIYQVEENDELLNEDGNFLVDSFGDNYYTIMDTKFDLRVATNGDNPNNVVNLGSVVVGGNTIDLGSYVKKDDSFQDIILTKLNDVYEIELENGDTSYAIYDDQLSDVIKQVSWPQKLINDLQVIYKDININQMIATGKWLEQLGEYVSASDTSGEYTSNISTALIHPLGLILSELFLGEIEESDNFNLYGSLMFNSKFDSDTVKALMLSLLGEDNYYQLKEQFEYFNEIFNVFMGPVLDEIAYYENFDLMSGNEASVQLYTYKAYLASMLISSNSAQWFYSTALSLLGSNELAEDIVNQETGYYYSYGKLSDLYPIYEGSNGLLQTLYNSYVATLRNQYIEEGDAAYPEYMYALKDYIANNSDSFDGRLTAVLNSVMSDANLLKIVENDYNAIVTAYNNVVDYIKEKFGEAAGAVLKDIESVLITPNKEDGDDFIYATQEYTIKLLKSSITDMNNRIEAYFNITDYNEDQISGLKSKLEEYYNAITTYADDKLVYITGDQSHKYVGQRNTLATSLSSYLSQAREYYKILKDSNYNLDGFNFIDPNDEKDVFGVVKKENELTSSRTFCQWKSLKDKYNTLSNNISALTYDDFKANNSDVSKEEFEEFYNNLQVYSAAINNYIQTQDKIDKLDRYNIVFAVNAIMSQQASTSLTVVVNNKHYDVGQNFTSAKFIEYVLGAEYLKERDYDVVFVSDDYKGLVSVTTTQNEKNETISVVNSFADIYDFLVELGDVSAVLYQMTNLVNLSANNKDNIVIGATSSEENDLAKYILNMLVTEEYIPTDLLCAFFDIDSSKLTISNDTTIDQAVIASASSKITSSGYEYNNSKLNTVMSYLLLTETNPQKDKYVDYTTMTLKELRTKCLNFLVNYEEQKGESTEQNQKRYLAVLALSCSDWFTQTEEGAPYIGAINNTWSASRREYITAFKADKQSQAVILRLAGLENRPYEELVGAEYTIDFNIKGVDEANGDIFIICTFDEEMKQYVPFLMSNKRKADSAGQPTDEEGKTWLQKYGYRNSYTEYYYTDEENDEVAFFPVIAKGVITEDGMPTAIRENDGYIEFYRDNIVIHDVSNVGLSKYFMSVDQISINYTGFSYMVNTFTKIFSGKSLVEHLVETIPRFAAHSDFNFCYGSSEEVVDSLVDGYTAMSFNFDTSVCPDMQNLYALGYMNIVVLIIGVVTILMALWKALWGVTGRMFDVAVLALLGPAVISTINLKSDSRDKDDNVQESSDDTYGRWKQTLSEKLLNVFAYAIGFNIFFIVVPIISDMTLFDTNSAFASLPLLNRVSVNFLNEVARVVFLIAAAYLSTRAPKLFAQLTKTSNGFDEGTAVLGNVKNTINEVGDRLSGQYLVDQYENAKEAAGNLVPGSAIAKEVKGKVQEVSTKIAAKVAKHAAIAHGVPPEVADKMSKELEKQMRNKVMADKKFKEARNAERLERNLARSGEDPTKEQNKIIEKGHEAREEYKVGLKQRTKERKAMKKEAKKAKKKAKKAEKKAKKEAKKSSK